MSLNVLGISGSLRSGSYHSALLRAAAGLMPEGVALSTLDYADVPLYNGDLGDPDAVLAARAAIAGADALLIAAPEYNHSVPGVLKNLLDWGSRPPGRSALGGKVAAVVSGSPGAIGGARGQQALKVVLLAAGVQVYAGPEVCVSHIDKKLDGDRLTDAGTEAFLRTWLAGFTGWAASQRR